VERPVSQDPHDQRPTAAADPRGSRRVRAHRDR
jgi:hypothetical protein